MGSERRVNLLVRIRQFNISSTLFLDGVARLAVSLLCDDKCTMLRSVLP